MAAMRVLQDLTRWRIDDDAESEINDLMARVSQLQWDDLTTTADVVSSLIAVVSSVLVGDCHTPVTKQAACKALSHLVSTTLRAHSRPHYPIIWQAVWQSCRGARDAALLRQAMTLQLALCEDTPADSEALLVEALRQLEVYVSEPAAVAVYIETIDILLHRLKLLAVPYLRTLVALLAAYLRDSGDVALLRATCRCLTTLLTHCWIRVGPPRQQAIAAALAEFRARMPADGGEDSVALAQDADRLEGVLEQVRAA